MEVIVLVAVGVFAVAALMLTRRAKAEARKRGAATPDLDICLSDEPSIPSTTYLGGPEDEPLSRRRVSLKLCATCGEMSPLASRNCRHCGAELPVPPAAAAMPNDHPTLRLERREKPAPGDLPPPKAHDSSLSLRHLPLRLVAAIMLLASAVVPSL